MGSASLGDVFYEGRGRVGKSLTARVIGLSASGCFESKK